MTKQFLWYDFETFGADPRRDRPSQFAAIRTDGNLRPLGQPEVFYCRPADDFLPHPMACLITGITPQQALRKGVAEVEFATKIRNLMLPAGTCVAGYNNIRFDDEVTRSLFYRNFFDPYEREYANGNSRWDLIDLLRACYALRPQGLEWPKHPDGKPSFKLEHLSAANGVEHQDAHDALADVRATIALAARMKQAQPRLFQYALSLRSQKTVAKLLNPLNRRPVVHSSAKIPALRGCTTLMWPLCPHPRLPKSVLCVDLNHDLEALLSADQEELEDRLFTPTADLPEGVQRPPIKAIASNHVPFVAPPSVLKGVDHQRIGLDLALCKANAEKLAAQPEIAEKVAALFAESHYPEETDPDLMIYSGGFFRQRDKALMAQLHKTPPQRLADLSVQFDDSRLPALLFRLRCRNWPDTLSADELADWNQYRQHKLTAEADIGYLKLDQFLALIAEYRQSADSSSQAILDQLEAWPMEIGLAAMADAV